MKNLEQILNSEPIFLGEWSGSKKFGIITDFEGISITEAEYKATEAPYECVECWIEYKAKMKAALEKWEPIKILFASYDLGNWEGDAFVLFSENGKLYEVNAGHCSCYGLENQWEPEEVFSPEIKKRLIDGTFGGNDFKSELKTFLGIK